MTVVYPMRFNDSIDIVLATSFLQVWFLVNAYLIRVSGITEGGKRERERERERDRGTFLFHLANHSCVVLCSFVGWFDGFNFQGLL